ncbi:MAG: spore coat protein CotJB [Bacilli bacterium]
MLFEDINYDIFGLKKELFSPKEALMYGNMSKDEYVPYKNYQVYKIVPKTEKEECLLKIYELDQIINDLNLYLDLHPNDEYYYSLFKRYVKEFEIEKEKYERNYGPLMLYDTDYDKYLWIINPWPWESSGDKYV